MATIAELGARVLRRLGVAVVAAADRPANAGTVTVTVIANRALQALDIPVPSAEQMPMATTIPVADIVTRALQVLGVIASDETPSAADSTVGTLAVGAVYDALSGIGVVSWSIAAIPRAVSEDFALLVALHLSTAFGKAGDPAQQAVLEARVRRYSLIQRAQAIAEARVQAIHAGLVAQGIASWSNAAIPQALADDYTSLTMMEVAPSFGVKVDMAAVPMIEARVRRYSLVLGAPVVAEQAVLAVHADLVARGKARWSVFDVPLAAERPLVVLAANHCAPAFALPADPAAGAVALVDLARLISLPSSGERVVAEYF